MHSPFLFFSLHNFLLLAPVSCISNKRMNTAKVTKARRNIVPMFVSFFVSDAQFLDQSKNKIYIYITCFKRRSPITLYLFYMQLLVIYIYITCFKRRSPITLYLFYIKLLAHLADIGFFHVRKLSRQHTVRRWLCSVPARA